MTNAKASASATLSAIPGAGNMRERLSQLRSRIARAAAACGRNPDEITLLAVSKTWPAAALKQAQQLGLRAFGENYVDEALAKAEQLAGDLEWHFIGPLQSNKTALVANHFTWVHSVDRLKIAQRLSSARPRQAAPLQLCVQVNISGEASKSGCAVADAQQLCAEIEQLPQLQLRGLMAIPRPSADPQKQYHAFAELRDLYQHINQAHTMDTLSMGMSADLEAAIRAGSTLVRVGTALFGTRTRKNDHAAG